MASCDDVVEIVVMSFAGAWLCGIIDMHISKHNATNGSTTALPMTAESIRQLQRMCIRPRELAREHVI